MPIDCDCERMLKMDYQPYPTTGRLASNINLDLSNLKDKIFFEQAEVYFYVVETIKNQNGYYLQTGSAPNFQGDMVSLCTCKHRMRTSMDTEDWVDKWIAGFSGVAAGNRNNVLVYLMKVGWAFKSQMKLWFSDKIPEETKQAKLAQNSKFGDIYKPKDRMGDEFSAQSYFHPIESHVHCNNDGWHNDINYEGSKGRKAALLIGDPEYSFLWNQPMIYFKGHLHRGQKKSDLQTLLGEQLTGK
jgi:hypothetical protein